MNEIEKAIQCLQNELGCIELDLANEECNKSANNFINTCNTSIQALQEKLEREKGCSECNKISCSNCVWQRCCCGRPMETKCTARDYKYTPRNNCHECGRKLDHIGEASTVEGE